MYIKVCMHAVYDIVHAYDMQMCKVPFVVLYMYIYIYICKRSTHVILTSFLFRPISRGANSPDAGAILLKLLRYGQRISMLDEV